MPTDTDVALYQIDRSTSRFTVRAFATGMLSALGHSPSIAIRDFTGEARLEPEPSLKLRIRADSLVVTDDIPSNERREMERTMHQDVLQCAKYPEIVYESTSVLLNQVSDGRWQTNLNGNLSLRGVTRGQNIVAQVTRLGDMLRANGEFMLAQSNFGIKPVSVAGGTLKLKDELKFAFDIVARKQES